MSESSSSIPPRTPSASAAAAASSISPQNQSSALNKTLNSTLGNASTTTTTAPYASPARTTHFKPSVLTSDVHNEAEIIFHILEHREKKCVSKLDMLTLLRGMGMNPTDGDLDSLHASMAPLIEEYEEMVREEEKRKERERKKMEMAKGGPKSTNPVKDRAEKDKKKLKDMKDSARGSGRSRPTTAGTGDSSEKDGEGGGKKKDRPKTDPPEEIKNIDWHIFMHSVEPIFKDARQEEKELLRAFEVFDPEGYGKMPMEKLIEIATQNGESVLSPAEVKQLREAFPDMKMVNFGEFTKKLLGIWVPPPPPTAEEIAAQKAKAAEEAKKRREAELNNLDGLIGVGGGGSPNTNNNNNNSAAAASPTSEGGGDQAAASPSSS